MEIKHSTHGYWITIDGWEFPTGKNKSNSYVGIHFAGKAQHSCYREAIRKDHKYFKKNNLGIIRVSKDEPVCRACGERISDQILFMGLLQRL